MDRRYIVNRVVAQLAVTAVVAVWTLSPWGKKVQSVVARTMARELADALAKDDIAGLAVMTTADEQRLKSTFKNWERPHHG